MQETTDLYKQIVATNDYDTIIKLTVTLADNTTVDYGMDKLVSLKIVTTILDSNTSERTGHCASAQMDVVIKYPSETIPRMAKMQPFFKIQNGSLISENWMPLGIFYVDVREDDYDIVEDVRTLSFTCYDAMLKLSQDYYTKEGDQGYWPKTDIAVVEEVAERFDLSIDPTVYSIVNKEYHIKYPGYGDSAYTVRSVLGNIAALYAGNWVITENGSLKLITIYNNTVYLGDTDLNRLIFGSDLIIVD